MGWRMKARDGGVETVGGDSRETGLVMKKNGKKKLMTGIGALVTPGYRDKEESNNICISLSFLTWLNLILQSD